MKYSTKQLAYLSYLGLATSALCFQTKLSKAKKGLNLDSALRTADSSYIADYHDELTLRIYGSNKYTSYGLHDKGYPQNLNYKPNSPFNSGVGFNYKLLAINLGFSLPMVNETVQNGPTKFIDLQTHILGRMLIFDFYVQRYKGFYFPKTEMLLDGNNQQSYIRPDLRTLNLGVSGQYLFNGQQFSFRGAFLQNEVQLKSAGSAIVGASVNIFSTAADSSIIPSNIRYTHYFNDIQFNNSNIKSINLNAGYGYTLVLPHFWFVTLAFSTGFGINHSSLSYNNNFKTTGIGTDLNATIRTGFGYNAHRFFVGVHYIGTFTSSSTPIAYARQSYGAGNIRISIAHRFKLKKKLLGFY